MTNLFEADQPQNDVVEQQPAATNQPAVDVNSMFADQLSTIVNEEGKPKYNSVEEALKGAANAQEYIRSLKSELDQFKTAAEKGAALSDVMDAIKSQQGSKVDQPVKTLGEEDVSVMFQQLLSKAKEDEIKSTNEAKFSDAVSSAYGDKSKEFVNTKAKELGINVQLLQEMAQTSPVAALQLLGVNAKQDTNPKMKSSVNTMGFDSGSNQGNQRTYSMGAGTTKDLVSEWNRCKAIVNNR